MSHRKLLEDDFKGDTAFHMAGTATEGVLPRAKPPERDDSCISWGPDFTNVRGTWLQDGLISS